MERLRPRELLWRRGTDAVGDEELLAVLLGTGVRARPARQLASELVDATGGMAALSRASPHELAQVLGIGEDRAARVVAAFELGRRAMSLVDHRDPVLSPDDVYHLVAPRLSGLQQEVFLAIGLDVRNGLLEVVEVARGGIASVEVHPREVFRPLLRMAAAGGVVVHNHPTGDPTPSADDIALTQRLDEVGRVIGIDIVDHVVIGAQRFRSVREYMGGDRNMTATTNGIATSAARVHSREMELKIKRNATLADLERTPEGTNGQLIDGVLYITTRPSILHALAMGELLVELAPYRRDRKKGWIILFEQEIKFGENVLIGDLCGWRRERVPTLPDVKRWELAPDWVCEALSPSTARIDRGRKREIYANAGVGHLWFIDPTNRTLEVLALDRRKKIYSVIASAGDDEKGKFPPFDDRDLDLSVLWRL